MNAVNEWSDPDVDCKNDLTHRQVKVLERLAEGHTMKEDARSLRL